MEDKEEFTETDFYTPEELYEIYALVNETIREVHYHYWVNQAKDHRYEVLDWIEFIFDSGKRMVLNAGVDSDGIKLHLPDIEAERAKLEDEFKGAVTIESRDVSSTKLWKAALGKAITPSLLKHEDKVLNDNMVLKFEGAKPIEIYVGLEGLEVEFFDGNQ